MQVNLNFSGNTSILLTYWKAGLMPSVKKGLYGGTLTRNNVSIEHLIPSSKGGASNLDNYALATKSNNSYRKNQPLANFLTKEQAEKYLKQFKGINLPCFNGDVYIKNVKKTILKCFQKKK